MSLPTIKHETPSQRRHFRVTAPVGVLIGDRRHPTINWSVLDFKIGEYSGILTVGDTLDVTLLIPYQGFEIRFPANIRVATKNEEEKTLSGEFMEMNERQKEILEFFVAGLIRGEMDSFEGVIRRMDLPVTPVSLKPDVPLTPEEIAEQERKRKIGGLLYLAAGGIFSLVLAVILYTNLFQIKVRTAVMAAPTDIILSPATGTVKEYHVQEREQVAKDASLITFEDPKLEQEIERAGLRLEDALSGAGAGAAQGGGGAVSREAVAARASVRALESTVAVKAQSVQRLREMLAQGLARKDVLDRTEAEYYKAQSDLNLALQRLDQQSQKSTDKLSALSIAEGEYSLLKEQRERMLVHAAGNGRLLTRLVQPGASVGYGDPVAIFQHESPKYVEAYLTREEALSVSVGTEATVRFPSAHATTTFRVEEVDYASQLVSKREGRYVLEQAGLSRDVLVRLAPLEAEDSEEMGRVAPGTSAVVVFSRRFFGE
jgi:multidrug resistance efflux pump